MKPQMSTSVHGISRLPVVIRTLGGWLGVLCAFVLISGSILSADVRVTCIVEPNVRLKNAGQLGCDFKNLGAQPVVLSAGDVRDGSFEKIGSPLRYSIAQQVIERSEKRGFWGTFFTVVKWIGVGATALQGFDVIQIGGKLQAVIPGITSALQTVDSVARQGYKPLAMPPDYLPEGDFVLDAHETRSYVLIAAKKELASFRMTLGGRTLTASGGILPGSAARTQDAALWPVEPFDRERMKREALERINEWVFESDRVYSIDDFTIFPQHDEGTEGSSRFAVPQVSPVSWGGRPADSTAGSEGKIHATSPGKIQAEPVKGIEVPTVAGAASAPGNRFPEGPLPLSRKVVIGVDCPPDAADEAECAFMASAAAAMYEWSESQR